MSVPTNEPNGKPVYVFRRKGSGDTFAKTFDKDGHWLPDRENWNPKSKGIETNADTLKQIERDGYFIEKVVRKSIKEQFRNPPPQ